MSELESKLQTLLDKQEIYELIHAYCHAADRRDQEGLRALYHEDATDDHGGFFKGLAMDFIDRLPEIQAPMEILHHNVTTVNIKLNGSRGEGEVYVLAFHKIKTDEGGMDLLIGGRYLDEYEKRDGTWKFAKRVVVADWVNVHDPSIVDLNSPLIEGSNLGRPDQEDPVYLHLNEFKRGS